MSLFRRLDTHYKLYASFALLLCMSAGLAWWLLAQAESANVQLSLLTAATGQKLSRVNIPIASDPVVLRQLAKLAIGSIATTALLLACWISAQISRPLHEATSMARRVADGDLSARTAGDQLGEAGEMLQSMQHMNDQLASMVIKLRAGSQGVAGNAGQLAANSMTLLAGGSEQAALLSSSAAALAELATHARQHGDDLHQAGALAQLSQTLAGIELANRAQLALQATLAAAAAAIRDEAGGLSRCTASFVLGAAYATPTPRLHLVSSNPHPLAKARHCSAGKLRPAIVGAMPDTTASPVPLRSRAGTGRTDMNWMEF